MGTRRKKKLESLLVDEIAKDPIIPIRAKCEHAPDAKKLCLKLT